LSDAENVPKAISHGDVSNEAPKDKELGTEQGSSVLENWLEIKDVPLQELFEKGWKPRIKTRTNGKRYIMLRYGFKDKETGKWRDTDKSLGLYDPEKWEALMSLYLASMSPKMVPQSFPDTSKKGHGGGAGKPSVLATRVARISPIGPTVHLELRTLQWYEWLRKDASYPGTLDDFINQSVNVLFKEHYNLELAVIEQGEE
jgi:hypothetical protein